ncbi:MAG: hypothetical protein ACRD2W_18900 [Acidimicrobiales bacterium]
MATLVWSSGEDMFFGSLLLVVLGGWAALGALGVAAFVSAARSRAPNGLCGWAIVWLGCHAALVGSVAVAVAGVPETVRIGLSRPGLIDAGETVLAGGHVNRAGLYGFSRTSVANGCALLETGTSFIDSFGFAYCPNGTPAGFDDLGHGLSHYHDD